MDSMTLKDFEQIIYVRNEIKELSKRLKKVSGSNFVADWVNDYSTGEARPISISGYDIADPEKVKKILILLERQKESLEDMVFEAEHFIASLPDSKIRMLLTLRFIEGLEWNEAAKRTYKKMTGDSARMSVVRFFGRS